MVAERTPTRYQRIRLFVSSSSPLALYPNTLYSTLSSRADLACSLSCRNPWILSPRIPLDRVRRPLCSISSPEPGTIRQFSASKARGGGGGNRGDPPPPCIGSRTTSLSGRNRRYPADGRPGSGAWKHWTFVVSPPLSTIHLGSARSCSRRDFHRFRRFESLFPAAESMSLTSATTPHSRWGNFDGEIW